VSKYKTPEIVEDPFAEGGVIPTYMYGGEFGGAMVENMFPSWEGNFCSTLGGLPDKPHDRPKTASDGGSTDYYFLPEHAKELRHLISHKGMSKARGDVFKACYRLGEKEGVDTLYDLNKMKFFVEDLIEMYHRGERL
jgi:hypothetical protein